MSAQLVRVSSHFIILINFTMFFNLRALHLAVLALCSMGTAVHAVDVHIAAIQPTAAGQIGVDLVDPIPPHGDL